MRVLIGYDASPSAKAALEELKRAAIPRESEILVVTVGQIWVPPPNLEMQQAAMLSRRATAAIAQFQAQAGDVLQNAKATAAEAALWIRMNFPEWLVESEAMGGEPATAIVNKADSWRADLIVVGSSNRSMIGRLFLGSVSQTVLLEAGCSVRIARADGPVEKGAPVRIIAGIDGIDTADVIIRSVAARDWARGSVLRIVTAVDAQNETIKQPFAEIVEAQECHADVQERLALSGIKLLSSVNYGDARDELLAEARKLHADCVFVGTRGIRGALNYLFPQGVSSGVAKDAACSVEVVRATAAA